MSEIIKEVEITEKEEITTGHNCDFCKNKVSENEHILFHKRPGKINHYYQYSEHHGDWGRDSVDSYIYLDVCEGCLDKAIERGKKFLKEHNITGEFSISAEIGKIDETM